MKPRILAGEYNDYWRIYGHALHVIEIDWATRRALGYGQPESRSITKLYNFNAITSRRQGRHERLHGKAMEFRPGYSLKKARRVWHDVSCAGSDLRCLHMCFVPRSPLGQKANGRPNPSELMKSKAFLGRAGRLLGLPRWDSGRRKNYKNRYYARGAVKVADITSFGRPGDWHDLDPKAFAVEELLEARGKSGRNSA